MRSLRTEDGLFIENLINCVVYDPEPRCHLLYDIKRVVIMQSQRTTYIIIE